MKNTMRPVIDCRVARLLSPLSVSLSLSLSSLPISSHRCVLSSSINLPVANHDPTLSYRYRFLSLLHCSHRPLPRSRTSSFHSTPGSTLETVFSEPSSEQSSPHPTHAASPLTSPANAAALSHFSASAANGSLARRAAPPPPPHSHSDRRSGSPTAITPQVGCCVCHLPIAIAVVSSCHLGCVASCFVGSHSEWEFERGTGWGGGGTLSFLFWGVHAPYCSCGLFFCAHLVHVILSLVVPVSVPIVAGFSLSFLVCSRRVYPLLIHLRDLRLSSDRPTRRPPTSSTSLSCWGCCSHAWPTPPAWPPHSRSSSSSSCAMCSPQVRVRVRVPFFSLCCLPACFREWLHCCFFLFLSFFSFFFRLNCISGALSSSWPYSRCRSAIRWRRS